MAEEVKSVSEIAQTHVTAINTENEKFNLVEKVTELTNQFNKPTDEMRAAITKNSIICESLSKYLKRDAEKINLMAAEFELWDEETGNSYEH